MMDELSAFSSDAVDGGLLALVTAHSSIYPPLLPDRAGLVLPVDCGNRSLAPLIGA